LVESAELIRPISGFHGIISILRMKYFSI